MSSPLPDSYRRNEHARRAILDAAIDFAIEVGYEKTSIEGIAKRARVGKQTIYRWWPSKGAVLLEALQQRMRRDGELADTGDLMADLRVELLRAAQLYGATPIGAVYQALLTAARSDAVLAEAHDAMVRPGIDAFRRRLQAAQELGQIRSDIDVSTLVDMLYGAILFQVLLRTRPLAPDQVDASLRIVFDGVRPQPSPGAAAQPDPNARID